MDAINHDTGGDLHVLLICGGIDASMHTVDEKVDRVFSATRLAGLREQKASVKVVDWRSGPGHCESRLYDLCIIFQCAAETLGDPEYGERWDTVTQTHSRFRVVI